MYFCCIAITIFGFALLWSLRLTLAFPNPPRDSSIVIGISMVAWMMVAIGLVAISGPFFLACLFILFITVAKYRESERRALLWTLAVAAEKEIPLGQAAKSFAADRIDEIGRRSQKLGELIDAGVPLPRALTMGKTPLPTDADLAVRIGYPTQTLHGTLRDAAKYGDKTIEAEQSYVDSLLNFLFVLVAMSIVFTFVCVWIVPTFRSIFMDFDLELPWITELFITLNDKIAKYWFLLAPLFVFLVVVLFYVGLRYLGFKLPYVTLAKHLLGNRNSPIILRSLRTSIVENQPITQALEMLTKYYPIHTVRINLAKSLEQTREGAHWCEALRRNGLIDPTDAAVLKSAERVGNLPWALAEMADRHSSRMDMRANLISKTLTPFFVLLLSIPVGFFAIAMFLPLIDLLHNLSR